MWNSIISVGNFYISINVPKYFNDFSLPSIIYFINFSLFQVRFLFIIWRFQNVDENEARFDEMALRRKLFRIYAILCKFNLFNKYFLINRFVIMR